jgi:hypothetical protein
MGACRGLPVEKSWRNSSCDSRQLPNDTVVSSSGVSRVRHIRIERLFMGLEPFYHHGIDLGDGLVAHYSKRSMEDPVRREFILVDRFSMSLMINEI